MSKDFTEYHGGFEERSNQTKENGQQKRLKAPAT